MLNRRKYTLGLIMFLFISIFISGCSNSGNTKMTDFVNVIQEDMDYDAEYIEDRNVIKVTDYLSKDAVIDAVSKDSVYKQWENMRENLLGLYDDIEELADSKNIKDTEYEIVIIDEDSSKTDKEIPLLIVNKTGILYDMVEEIRNSK